MGLSNEERLSKMFWAVHHLSLQCRELKAEGWHRESIEHLQELGDKLWHALLEGKRDSAYWILGGDLDSGVTGPNSPWGVLIEAQCEEAQASEEPSRDDLPFDPFRCFLSVEGLAGQGVDGEFRRNVLGIYREVESLIYGLRRYTDTFRLGFENLDRLASNLLGACFAAMQGEDGYAKAYVGNRLMKWIYGQWGGPVWKALNEVNMHHYLSRFMSDYCTLAEVIAWDEWRLTHKDTVQNRLVLALRMAGRRFHYDHQFTQLVKATRGLGVREKVLKREFAKCIKAHEAHEAENQGQYVAERDSEENTVIHGFDYKSQWERKGDRNA